MRPIRTWAGVVKGYRRTSWLAAIALVCCPTGSLLAQSTAPADGTAVAPLPAAGGSLELKVRRLPEAVELVIENTGPAPQMQQTTRGATWEGLLQTTSANGLRRGPQRLSLPEAGLQSISIDGSGLIYRLSVSPMPGYPVARPVVSADGRNLILSFSTPPQASLQTMQPNLTMPGRVGLPAAVPPLQPRAVAPPLGDMAVGTMMLSNPSYVRLQGPRVTMKLRNAPARDALMSLAQLGGYGFVYVDEQPRNNGSDSAQAQTTSAQEKRISISFRGESFERAINSALLAAGLQGKLDGNMILAGPAVLGKGFGPQMSKVYRLNQANAGSAADYLASLGALITKVTTTTSTSTTFATNQANAAPGPGGLNATSGQQTAQQTNLTQTDSYGASTGPLRGLLGTTDSRLGTITLVGDPRLVGIAESYLKQIDLRQRQVALAVKILDVSLDNNKDIENSFAFRYSNNYIVNDGGRLLASFGRNLPAAASGFAASEVKDNFYDFVRATILSTTTKVLASPTLILSENQDEIKGGSEVAAQLSSGSSGTGGSSSGGTTSSAGGGGVGSGATIGRPRANESFVTVGEQVITSYDVQPGTLGAPNSCQPQFGIAGLTFGARVSKIDDNGFVTFTLSPQLSATTRQQQVQGCGPIDILAVRRLDTGSARVRDGQTLILTGVISDSDAQVVQKWPILGDIPLIGQFFRNSSSSRRKRELVIMVTPRIINDVEGGTYGYGYQAGTPEARELLSGGR